MEVGDVSTTNPKTDLVLAPISNSIISKDVGSLGCASVFLTEEIFPGVGSQLSSVHVELKTQLTLDSEIPFSFMATSSNVEQNINEYDLMVMNVDEGYVYDDSMVYCQCYRCLPYAQIFDIMGDEILATDEEDNDANMRNKISVNVKGSTKCKLSKVAWMKMQLLENFLSPLKDATEW